jgi:hypothetical protein
MTTYAYEVMLRGTPDRGLKVAGCHLVESVVVNGKDYPGDPMPINYADLKDLLPEWFSGMAGQVAAAEAARDAALAEVEAANSDRDEKVAAAEQAAAAHAEAIAALQARIDELTATPPPPPVDEVHIAYVKQALDEAGKLDAVDAAADAAGKGALWRFATSITGTEPDVMAIAQALGIDLDAILTAARTIRASRG